MSNIKRMFNFKESTCSSVLSAFAKCLPTSLQQKRYKRKNKTKHQAHPLSIIKQYLNFPLFSSQFCRLELIRPNINDEIIHFSHHFPPLFFSFCYSCLFNVPSNPCDYPYGKFLLFLSMTIFSLPIFVLVLNKTL